MTYLAFAAFALGAAFTAPSWMANLGVVPLFLSAAFLLAPAALLLALRRFSVTAVLEAMVISQCGTNKLSILKINNLAISLLFVKMLLLMPTALFGQTQSTDIILAKGEQKEILAPKMKNFSVGNRDVISYRPMAKQGKLLLKGKQVGFTDLIIWGEKGKEVYSVYVLSKQKFLKTFQLAEALKNLNLAIDIKGPVMTASGTLSDFSDYLYLQKIKSQFQDQVFFKITLHPTLRNHIIGQVYKKLYANGLKNFSCQADWMDILCFHESSENAGLLTQLANFYRITFIKQDSRHRHKNWRLKFKLIQLEKLDGREIHMGLDKLQAKVSDIFKFGISKLIDENMVFLSQNHTELSTLAEPEMVVNLHSPQSIEIGSQIPYQNISTQGASVIAPIEWRFAGLKIKTKITEVYGKFLLDYETEFSRPVNQSISGNKEMASALLELNTPIKVFQIQFQTTTRQEMSIPLLGDIPILKHLFTSQSDQRTYKQLYGYVVLEEIDE